MSADHTDPRLQANLQIITRYMSKIFLLSYVSSFIGNLELNCTPLHQLIDIHTPACRTLISCLKINNHSFSSE